MPRIKDFLKNIGVITTSTQLHEKLGLSTIDALIDELDENF
jgi:hypothetical protein